MKSFMYAAVAFAAISVGVTAIGFGKAVNAFGHGEPVQLSGTITVHCVGCGNF